MTGRRAGLVAVNNEMGSITGDCGIVDAEQHSYAWLGLMETYMAFATRRIALERLLRQRSVVAARANEAPTTMALPISIPKVVVAAGLVKYDDCAVRQLLAAGRRRGYITFDELNDMLPTSEISAEEIEAVFEAICGLGIEVTES
jgi:hypothetical protein